MFTTYDWWKRKEVSSEKPQLHFGYNVVPGTALAAWGARAIMDPGPTLGLLHDRQSWCYKTPEARTALLEALNDAGVLAAIRQSYKTLVNRGEVTQSDENEVVLYEDDNVKAVGNSNASHGYFYLACWLKGGDAGADAGADTEALREKPGSTETVALD
jgi:hypothetical protein